MNGQTGGDHESDGWRNYEIATKSHRWSTSDLNIVQTMQTRTTREISLREREGLRIVFLIKCKIWRKASRAMIHVYISIIRKIVLFPRSWVSVELSLEASFHNTRKNFVLEARFFFLFFPFFPLYIVIDVQRDKDNNRYLSLVSFIAQKFSSSFFFFLPIHSVQKSRYVVVNLIVDADDRRGTLTQLLGNNFFVDYLLASALFWVNSIIELFFFFFIPFESLNSAYKNLHADRFSRIDESTCHRWLNWT